MRARNAPSFLLLKHHQQDMKKITKRYAAPGMMEWQALIPVGNAHLHVSFSGGSATGYGMKPARYTTSDPLTQKLIEHSRFFQQGRIVIDKVTEEEVAEPKNFAAAQQRPTEPSITGTTQEDDAQNGLQEQKDEKPLAADGQSTEQTETKDSEGNTVIKVGNTDEARDYLVFNYGGKVRELRSKDAIRQMAASKGIVFEGI